MHSRYTIEHRACVDRFGIVANQGNHNRHVHNALRLANTRRSCKHIWVACGPALAGPVLDLRRACARDRTQHNHALASCSRAPSLSRASAPPP